jgi:hypothetical protein
MGAVLIAYRREFQSQAIAGLYAANNRVRPDLPFLNEKFQLDQGTQVLWRGGLYKQTAKTYVPHS